MKFETVNIAVLDEEDEIILNKIIGEYENISVWNSDIIEKTTKEFCNKNKYEYKNVAMLLQCLLSGRRYHIGYKSIVYILGLEEVKDRITIVLNDSKKK